MNGVHSWRPEDNVSSGVTRHGIRLADGDIRSGPVLILIQKVIATTTRVGVVTDSAEQIVIPAAAGELVIAAVGENRVIAVPTIHDIIAAARDNQVITTVAAHVCIDADAIPIHHDRFSDICSNNVDLRDSGRCNACHVRECDVPVVAGAGLQ